MATKEEIVEVLKKIEDPELFIDIWFLGLIYRVDIREPEEGQVGQEISVDMTFTSAMCPAGPQLIGQVKQGIAALPGVAKVEVKVVFSPPWQPSDDVKAMLGLI